MLNKILMICLLCFLSINVFANTELNYTPATIKVDNKNIILPGAEVKGNSKIYFIQNTSHQSLWIDHPVDHPSATAGWSSYLLSSKWSAIVVDKNFIISCAVIHPGTVDYQNCSKVISVFVPKKVNTYPKRKGAYWLIENQSQDDLLKALEPKSSSNSK